MFIDEIQDMQTRGERLKNLYGGLSTGRADALPAPSDAEYEDMKAQLKLLDATCPRYDVFNVYKKLNPDVLQSDTPIAAKKNAAAIEERESLINLASKAPLGPPWFVFAIEYRHDRQQRHGYLVRWDTNRKYVCTSMFDSVCTPGMVEFIPNSFELLLGDDDMFGGYDFKPELTGRNLDSAKQGAEVVRVCIELLNWDREDVRRRRS